MKTVISSRYYPSYHGRRSTQYSYRSIYIGAEPAQRSADYIIGYCDDSVPDGWVPGPRGNPTRTSIHNQFLAGFKAK
jgi:hypothetical protein